MRDPLRMSAGHCSGQGDGKLEEAIEGEQRVVLGFHPKIAPIKAAVFPLVKKAGMPEIAHAVEQDLRRHVNASYDEKGSIGKRYRRMDEAGTPYCITIDGETLDDGTVTIRDRDTLEQIRIPKDNVVAFVQDKVRGW